MAPKCAFAPDNLPTKLSLYALCSFIITFTIMGLSVSVSGPSVMFLEEIAYTWEDEIALIFTGRSVGALGGWLLSVALLEGEHKHCGCLIGFGLVGLALVNFGVAFSHHLWWLMAAFAFQGGFIVVAAQGCLAYVTKYSTSPKRIYQLLVFCSLIGCALTPILFIPLTSDNQLRNGSAIVPIVNENESVLHASATNAVLRTPRSLEDDDFAITEGFQPTQMPQTLPHSSDLSSQPPVISPPNSLQGRAGNLHSLLISAPERLTTIYENYTTFSTGSFEQERDESKILSDTMNTDLSITYTVDAPMKPSVVDAEHLNQDSKSADGSNTAAKMKLADDDVRLAISEDSKMLDVPKDGEMMKPSLVDATHLSQDRNTADGSSTADKMKKVDDDIHDDELILPPIVVSPPPPFESEPESSKNVTAHLFEPPDPPIAVPLGKNNSVVSPPVLVEIPASHNEKKLRSNDSYRLTSSYNIKWDRRAPRRWHDERIRFQYMKSVRYVYVSMGLLTIIAWFILLPLTGLIPYIRPLLECFTIKMSQQRLQGEDQSHEIRSCLEANDDVERTDEIEYPQDEAESPIGTESPPLQMVSKTVSWSAKEAGSELREKSAFHVSVSVPNLAVLRSVRHNPSQFHHKNIESNDIEANEISETPEQSVYLNYAPEPTIWPLVTWPMDFWVLSATFLFAGLETTYGAFIHSFTLRTLHWTPVDALLVTTVFWSGDALGRLCYLCLGSNSDMGINLLQNAVDFPPKRNLQPMSPLPVRHESFKIAALFIRTVGSLICLICATMMKEMTSSQLIYYPRPEQSGSMATFQSWSTSRDRATWMATLGLGLGLGATASSGLNVYHPHGHRFYLALLLGQLAVPATSGYLTERMLHKNASETLGRTTVVLSLLMFLSLLIDLLLRALRRFVCWKIVTNWLSCLAEENESEEVGINRRVMDSDRQAETTES